MARLAVVALALLAFGCRAADLVDSAGVQTAGLGSEASVQDLPTDGAAQDDGKAKLALKEAANEPETSGSGAEDEAHSGTPARSARDQQRDVGGADQRAPDEAAVRLAVSEPKDTQDTVEDDDAHSGIRKQSASDPQSDDGSADHKALDEALVRHDESESKDTQDSAEVGEAPDSDHKVHDEAPVRPDERESKDSAEVGKASAPGVMEKGYGNYQQYTGKYAADYQKYMSQGGQGASSGNLPEYAQQFVSQHASSFSGYMDRHGQQSQGDVLGAVQSMQSGGGQGQQGGASGGQQGGAGGDYQQYMYYQKYMQGGAGGAQQGGVGGDYQQYMDYQKYMQFGAGGGQQGGAGGDYQNYMDYQKYMQGGAGGGQHGGVGGDYQQYMGYQKYMQGQQGGGADGKQSGGAGVDYQKYMSLYAAIYQKYANQGHQSNDTVGQSKAQSGDYKAYMQKYAGDYQKYMGQGGQGSQSGSQGGDYQKYIQQFAADYQQYIKKNITEVNGELAPKVVPASAADCKTEDQLKAWRHGQKDQIQQWVPASFQQPAFASIENEYEKSLARIQATGEDITTVEDHSDTQDDAKGQVSSDNVKSGKPVVEDGKLVKQDAKSITDVKGDTPGLEDGKSSDSDMGVADGGEQSLVGVVRDTQPVAVFNASAESAAADGGRTGVVLALLLSFGFVLPAGFFVFAKCVSVWQLHAQEDVGTPFLHLDAMP